MVTEGSLNEYNQIIKKKLIFLGSSTIPKEYISTNPLGNPSIFHLFYFDIIMKVIRCH